MFNIVLALVGLVAALFLLQRKRSATKPFPPGPRGWPIIGNTLNSPSMDNYIWLFFAEKAKKYGDIMGFRTFGQHLVILNAVEDAHELLGQTQCNDRPASAMLELFGTKENLATDHYGPHWRVGRKIFHHQMNKNAVHQFSPFAEQQARQFVARLHKRPEAFMAEAQLTAAKIILGITYGVTVESMDDDLVKLPVQFVSDTFEAVMNFHAVNHFRFLRYLPLWMPGSGDSRLAAKWRNTKVRMAWNPFKTVQHEMAEGTHRPSFVSRALERKDVEEDTILWLSSAMYAAGADTTYSTMHSFFLAMVLFPDAQRKAQEELDRVCPDRLPSLADREHMPYINAVVSETLRWWSLVPVGFPHVTTEDILYKGYFIPKGTTIMANSWSISQDTRMYPEPELFRPERFLGSDKAKLPMDPRRFAFGYGRRICPGLDFADMTIFLSISSVLATFTISNALDDAGKPIVPEVRTPNGQALRHIQPFECSIKPRSAVAEGLIKECALS